MYKIAVCTHDNGGASLMLSRCSRQYFAVFAVAYYFLHVIFLNVFHKATPQDNSNILWLRLSTIIIKRKWWWMMMMIWTT